MSLLLVAKCIDCHTKMECKNIYSRSRLKRCPKCRDHHKYEVRKLILKARRMKLKKCHWCGGLNQLDGVFCTPYCRWINKVKNQSHGKKILRVRDL